MEERNYVIRIMTCKEADLAVEWAAQEGWNPGFQDAECFYTADPNGFLVGLLEGEPIASISVVKYGDSFGFLGFYIVKPEYRGQGYGFKLWNAGMKYLSGCNIGLDGVVAQQDNYQKSGFKLAYRNIRYQGKGGVKAPDDANIVELASLPFETIAAYDQLLFPAQRSLFIKGWISQTGGAALGIQQNKQLAGYGVIRKCRSGYKIGPLFANSPELAERLFLALKSKAGADESVFLDVREVNSTAITLAEKYKMNVVFETARMYTGENPDVTLDNIYGVTSFELG